MKTACFIQQRLGSSRLPGKALMDIEGKTLTERVIERVLQATKVGKVYVIIPEEENSFSLWRNVSKTDAQPLLFDIDPSDVVGRHLYAANIVQADIAVRIPGDNPCVDPEEIDRMVEAYNDNPAPWNWLTTNLDRDVLGNGYPGGLGCEVYDVRFLEWMNKHLTEKRHREHPHLWAFEQQHVCTIQAPADIRRPWMDFSVNNEKDLEFVRDIYRNVAPGFSIRAAIEFLDTQEYVIA